MNIQNKCFQFRISNDGYECNAYRCPFCSNKCNNKKQLANHETKCKKAFINTLNMFLEGNNYLENDNFINTEFGNNNPIKLMKKIVKKYKVQKPKPELIFNSNSISNKPVTVPTTTIDVANNIDYNNNHIQHVSPIKQNKIPKKSSNKCINNVITNDNIITNDDVVCDNKINECINILTEELNIVNKPVDEERNSYGILGFDFDYTDGLELDLSNKNKNLIETKAIQLWNNNNQDDVIIISEYDKTNNTYYDMYIDLYCDRDDYEILISRSEKLQYDLKHKKVK